MCTNRNIMRVTDLEEEENPVYADIINQPLI